MPDTSGIVNPTSIGTAVGIVIGVLSTIAVGYAFKNRPGMAAKTNSLELVGPNAVLPTEISFLFRGVEVPKVTLTKVAIWNSGNTTLSAADIVGADPLRIVLSAGSRVLEAALLVRTRDVNALTLNTRRHIDNELECRFDYLDPGDGAVIQLIHTGTTNVHVVGTLRGVRTGVRMTTTPRAEKAQPQPEPSRAVSRGIAIGSFALGLTFPVLKAAGLLKDRWPMVLVLVGLTALLGALGLLASRYMPPGKLGIHIGSDDQHTRAVSGSQRPS